MRGSGGSEETVGDLDGELLQCGQLPVVEPAIVEPSTKQGGL